MWGKQKLATIRLEPPACLAKPSKHTHTHTHTQRERERERERERGVQS